MYPFNPQTIDCSISAENPEASLARPSDEQTDTGNGVMENGDENTVTEFSIKQEKLFQTRFEEGYDFMDPDYLCWLEINHPDSVSADRHMLVLAPESSAGSSGDNPTLTDIFSFVQPSSPLSMSESATSSNSSPTLNSTITSVATTPHVSTTEPAVTPPSLESTPSASTTKPAETSPSLESAKTPVMTTLHVSTTKPETSPTLESAKTPVTTTPCASTTKPAETSLTLDSVVHSKAPMMTTPRTLAVELAKTSPPPGSSVHSKTPVMTPRSTSSSEGTSSGESDHELRYISKYLVQVISTATPESSTSAAKRVSGARVLTSAKCAAILEE